MSGLACCFDKRLGVFTVSGYRTPFARVSVLVAGPVSDDSYGARFQMVDALEQRVDADLSWSDYGAQVVFVRPDLERDK